MASNPHGTSNELEIANYLNGKRYKDLNLTMKEFIKYICLSKGIEYTDETLIIAKADEYIAIGDLGVLMLDVESLLKKGKR